MSGEPTLPQHGRCNSKAKIRADHLGRYEWAAKILEGRATRVLDAACGSGYGTKILAQAGFDTWGIDVDEKTITEAQKNYASAKTTFIAGDIQAGLPLILPLCSFDAVISFETLEHLDYPGVFLRDASLIAGSMLLSVPNEAVYSFQRCRPLGHRRHYTKSELIEEINPWWIPVQWFTQATKTTHDPLPGDDGRTLIVELAART